MLHTIWYHMHYLVPHRSDTDHHQLDLFCILPTVLVHKLCEVMPRNFRLDFMRNTRLKFILPPLCDGGESTTEMLVVGYIHFK